MRTKNILTRRCGLNCMASTPALSLIETICASCLVASTLNQSVCCARVVRSPVKCCEELRVICWGSFGKIAVIADIARDRRDREIKTGLPRIDADGRG